MLSSNCAVCSKRKSTVVKNKELHSFDQFKMNKIINKFLLTEDKFMPELHLKQPRFTYSACGSFIKLVKEFKNLKYLIKKKNR